MVVVGLVGKPNVGKSTFFSAATLASVPIANYPFTTKKANVGVTYVAVECVCKEFNVKDNPVNSACIDGVRFCPVNLVDCPGLVPEAWRGRGLGNQFLDEVRRADVLLLILDAAGATDEEGRLCEPGTRNPVEDLKFLEKEFDMWFFQVLKKDWDKIARKTETLREDLVNLLTSKLSGLQVKRRFIEESLDELNLKSRKPSSFTDEDLEKLASNIRRRAKPVVVVANKVDIPQAEKNIKLLKETGYPVIPCSAEAELVLRRAAEARLIDYKPGDSDFKVLDKDRLTEKQILALKMVKDKVLRVYGNTGVQQALNFSLFNVVGLIAVFPVEDENKLADHHGRVLPDCYLVPKGTSVKEFAGMIHSELAETFIYAVDVRSKRRVGEEYILRHKDVIKIVSAKGRG
ncbi:MAG: redox-regulated ATPase YchF [Candidatus Bathyarchaeota archaeon]